MIGTFFAMMVKHQDRKKLCEGLKRIVIKPRGHWKEEAFPKFVQFLVFALQDVAKHFEKQKEETERFRAQDWAEKLKAMQEIQKIEEGEQTNLSCLLTLA